jgi:hypothetical protein
MGYYTGSWEHRKSCTKSVAKASISGISAPLWEAVRRENLRLRGDRSERNAVLAQLSLRRRSRESAARKRGNNLGGSSRHSERAEEALGEEDTPRSACGSEFHCGRRNPYT